MAIFSEVQCSRCDRHFSGIHSRCPYCGARRGSHGKHADDGDNMRVQVIVGICLMVALIAAVVVLLITNGVDKTGEELPPSGEISGGLPIPDEGDNTSGPGVSLEPTDSATPPVDSTPSTIPIENVEILYAGVPVKDKDCTMSVTEVLNLTVRTVPTAVDEVPIWESSDEDKLMVAFVSGTNACKITAIDPTGTTPVTLTCTVGDITDKLTVRIKR